MSPCAGADQARQKRDAIACRVGRWDYDVADDRFECTPAHELELVRAIT